MAMVAPRSPTSSSPSDFNFNNIASAPSSPKPFGNPNEYFYFYTSAPSSPNHAPAIYSYFEATTDEDLEEVPISPKLGNEFEFGLDLPLNSKLSTADELFEKGQIRSPLRPDSSRHRKENCSDTMKNKERREARSLSPMSMRGDEDHAASTSTSTSASSGKRSGSRKWRLKDLLLFRSSSEGRATGRESKDPLRKYSLLPSSSSSSLLMSPSNNKKKEGDGTSTKRGSKPVPVVSAHELHYTENRAASEEMKKRTPLPYNRNSFFGCLHFNPAVRSLTGGFNNSSSFNRGRSS